MFVDFTVSIYKQDIFRVGSIYALVDCSSESPVLLIYDELDIRIILPDVVCCSISGSIIYQDYFISIFRGIFIYRIDAF